MSRRRLPAVRPREAIAALQRAGFVIRRITGSHYRLGMPGDPSRWVVVAYHNRDLHPKTLRSIIRQAGLTVDEFIDLL
jgi:predicted RNA binding protein YcfA (HicA-like mRNA interferase family)